MTKLGNWVALAAVSAAIFGCSQESKEKYGEAGQQLKSAAQNTGEAIQKDTKVAVEASKDAAKDAQKAFVNSAANDVLTTGKVKAALVSAKDVEAKDLSVETTKGLVTLKGTVPSAEQKKRAYEIASQTAGDRYLVNNELTVAKQ